MTTIIILLCWSGLRAPVTIGVVPLGSVALRRVSKGRLVSGEVPDWDTASTFVSSGGGDIMCKTGPLS